MSYDDAVAIQHRHEPRLLALPGVTAVGTKLRADRLVLEVSVDPDQPLPAELDGVSELDGLPVVIERARYELQ